LEARRNAIGVDQMGVSLAAGHVDRAHALSLASLSAYRLNRSILPIVVHDAAQVLLRNQDYSSAFPILRALLRYFPDATYRVRALASLSLAAAGSCQIEVFRSTWEEAMALLDQQKRETRLAAPTALAHFARGAVLLNEHSIAESAISMAECTAKEVTLGASATAHAEQWLTRELRETPRGIGRASQAFLIHSIHESLASLQLHEL
jgi:hypothetical protein